MAQQYCISCKRNVDTRRKIGIGTFIMVIITGFFWLLAIPFYSKRCPICEGTNFKSVSSAEKAEKKTLEAESALDKVCPFCAETIKKEALKCKHCGSNLEAEATT